MYDDHEDKHDDNCKNISKIQFTLLITFFSQKSISIAIFVQWTRLVMLFSSLIFVQRMQQVVEVYDRIFCLMV